MKPSLVQSALFAEQRLAGDVARSERRCSIRSAGREESVERPMITLEQLDAITAAAGERWRSLIDMAAWCGLRFGELAALRKNRIDLDTETVMVAESASVLAGGVRHVGPRSLTPAVGPWRSRHI